MKYYYIFTLFIIVISLYISIIYKSNTCDPIEDDRIIYSHSENGNKLNTEVIEMSSKLEIREKEISELSSKLEKRDTELVDCLSKMEHRDTELIELSSKCKELENEMIGISLKFDGRESKIQTQNNIIIDLEISCEKERNTNKSIREEINNIREHQNNLMCQHEVTIENERKLSEKYEQMLLNNSKLERNVQLQLEQLKIKNTEILNLKTELEKEVKSSKTSKNDTIEYKNKFERIKEELQRNEQIKNKHISTCNNLKKKFTELEREYKNSKYLLEQCMTKENEFQTEHNKINEKLQFEILRNNDLSKREIVLDLENKQLNQNVKYLKERIISSNNN